jgi:phage head maturation protease
MRWRLSGLALPWDVTTKRAMHRWRFEPGSIEVPARLRLLRDHDNAQEIGLVERVEDRLVGLWVRGWSREWVSTREMLSVSFDVLAERREGGVRVIERALVPEVSVVEHAAYSAARIEMVEAG